MGPVLGAPDTSTGGELPDRGGLLPGLSVCQHERQPLRLPLGCGALEAILMIFWIPEVPEDQKSCFESQKYSLDPHCCPALTQTSYTTLKPMMLKWDQKPGTGRLS